MADLWQMIGARHILCVLKWWDTILSGLIFLKKIVPVGIKVNSEDYRYFSYMLPLHILILLPSKKKLQIQPVLSSSLITRWAEAVGFNSFLFNHRAKDILYAEHIPKTGENLEGNKNKQEIWKIKRNSNERFTLSINT